MQKTGLCIIFFGVSALAAATPFQLDLTRDCSPEKKACQGRVWYLRHGFDSAFLNAEPQKDWKEVRAFPISVKKLLPVKGTLETFTMVHFFDLPADFLSGNAQPAISMGNIGEVFEIFVNGNLVVAEGATAGGEITLHRTVHRRVYAINPAFLKQQKNQLLIKVQGDPDYILTGLGAAENYFIGSYEHLTFLMRDRIGMILNAVYLFVGLYHLLLFSKRRKEVYNAYFALYCITISTFLFLRSNIVFEWPIDISLLNRLATVVLLLTGPLLLFFLNHLFSGKIKKTAVFSLIFCLALVPPVLIAREEIVQAIFIRIWILVVILVFIPYVFIEIIKAVRAKHLDAKRMLAGTLVYFSCILFDLIDALSFRTGVLITKYGFSFYILGIAVILANRFLRLHNQVEELNLNLEKKVTKRTEELQQTLSEVHALKTQQDGDYFLTSLLINPLSGNFSSTKNVNCEIFTRQKKHFRFKKWESAIGGDLSIVHSILLRGKPYTVFLNADAMGKSMQGAGGSIVCGTLFKTIITRTQTSSVSSGQFPEQWLDTCFQELQNVFVSFEGTMMISAVIGLIEDDSGLVYYVNAEHPSIVLYRNQRAYFVDHESEVFLRKIGIDGTENDFVVRTARLAPGDVLIVGSDGRDDIGLTGSPNSYRLINEDETLFLKVVEAAHANLDQVGAMLQKSGEIIDDLSLIRIGFCENANSKIVKFDSSDDVLNQGVAYLRQNDYTNAVQYLEKYVSQVPEDTEALFLISFALKRMADRKKIRLAIEYGECCRLRDPKMVRNLNNLADCYRLLKNEERAHKLLVKALEIEPANERTLHLMDKIAPLLV